MSTPIPTPQTPAPALCNGNDINYKAYSFPFGEVRALCILATCWFGRGEMNVSLVQDGARGSFKFMQNPPTATFAMNTFYAAHWTSGPDMTPPPESVTITDARGTHHVKVVKSP